MSSPDQAAPGARRILTLLIALNLLCYIDRYILNAVLPDIRDAFFAHDDPDALFKTGLLTTVFLISYMVTAPIFGWMADRTSRWILIGAGVGLWSFASIGSGWAPTFAIMLVARAFVGIGEAAYGPAAPTILSDMFPLRRRGMVFAWFLAAIPVGSALGYVFGGQIGHHYGWRAPFHWAAVPGIALALVCFFIKDRRHAPGAVQKAKATWADYKALFKIPSYRLNVAAQTAMTFAIGGLSVWAPYYFAVTRGQNSLAEVNLIFGGITAVAGLLSTLFGGWIADRLARKTPGAFFIVSATGMLIAFPCTIAMLYAPFPWAWVLAFLAVFFLFFNIGPANTAIANVTQANVQATAFAVNIFVIHALGDAISPPLIGAIADRSSLTIGFFVVSLTMLLAGIFWLLGIRHLPTDTAKANAISAAN